MARRQEQRMLGYIIPRDDMAWFVKLVDSPEKVAAVADELHEIVLSVDFSQPDAPSWELPEGWSDQIVRQITYANLNNREQGVSATVTPLPAPTESVQQWQASVAQNVNRWRGQLNLPDQPWSAMQGDLEEVPELAQGDSKAYFVDLQGMQAAGGGAPFLNRMSGGGADSPPSGQPGRTTAASTTNASQTPDTPVVSQAGPLSTSANDGTAAATTPRPSGDELSYEVPTGWQEVESSGIRRAAFEISEGELSGEVSVSTAGGEPEMLVGMWLGQAQQERTSERTSQIIEQAEEITVNDATAQLFHIEAEQGDSILVARIPWSQGQALFVKMTGPAQLLQQQRGIMKKFLNSLSW